MTSGQDSQKFLRYEHEWVVKGSAEKLQKGYLDLNPSHVCVIQDWEKPRAGHEVCAYISKTSKVPLLNTFENRSFWNNANTFTFKQRLATHTELELAQQHPFVCTKHGAGVGRGG